MDLVDIFEVIFGTAFVFFALIGSVQIFGGMFYTKRVKAIVGEKTARRYVRIDGQTYTGRNDMNLAEKRNRRRHKQSGNRKKQKYREHTVEHICFTYEDSGELHTTDPKATICPISPSFVDASCEYNIKVSRNKPWKARLGLFEILRVYLCQETNIIVKFISCILIIGNALMYLAADVGLAALGVWIINLGINGIR